jgi:PAS domain S-box-containing protein
LEFTFTEPEQIISMADNNFGSPLEDQEQRRSMLAAIIDSSEDAIISKDLNGIINSWNKSAEQMFGYKEEEVLGKHISILIPEDRLTEEDTIIAALRRGERIEHYQTIRKRKDGTMIHLSLSISPIKNFKGIIIGASKIARDITRQKEAEELVKQYTKRLELLDAIGKSIVSQLDVEGILQKVTDTTTFLTGAAFGAFFYNKNDSKGESYMLYTLSGASKEDFEKFGMPRNTEVFDTTFSGKGTLLSPDITKDPRYGKNKPHSGMPKGHLPVVSYLAVPVISQAGVVIGGLFFGHPKPNIFKEEHASLVEAIATQAAIALDNAKLYSEVQALNNKKDEFIGFASHELKTPLTTISGYLQLAEKTPELAKDFLPRIGKQVNRLSAIISDLLDISKIHAGRLDLHSGKTSLLALVKDSVETVKQQSPSHEFECDLPQEDVMLMVDGPKMSQVLINILTNAVKYSPDNKKIVITAMRFGDQVRISVQDWGMGISPKNLDKIFNRFYRVSRSSAQTEGMGLGLYISREIVEGHHGRIWAESEEGKGSTFNIDFPISTKGMGDMKE